MKILIAEDSASSRLVIERELRSLGHECIVAEDGIQAWDLFQGSGAEVVISDWMMPGVDGDELCRRVRADTSAPYAYFIILTSLEGRDHVINGMRAGADDFLAKPFNRDDLEARLIAAARVTELHRRVALQGTELTRLNATLFADSRRDHLTGIGNRKKQDEDLDAWAARAELYGHIFSVALFDIDNFKAYNDGYGHAAGDEILYSVAHALRRGCRADDFAYRYGGEEFLIALAGQTLEDAAKAGERMRTAVERMAIPFSKPGPRIITVSGGVAQYDSADGAGVAKLLETADSALYEAKRTGRNRVVVRGPSIATSA